MDVLNGKCACISVWKILGKRRLAIILPMIMNKIDFLFYHKEFPYFSSSLPFLWVN